MRFEAGEGPRLDPLDTPDAGRKRSRRDADFTKLEPVYEALRRVRSELDPKIALIGFCGAPWTVATYMVAGQGTPDQAPARMLAYREPEAFAQDHRRAGRRIRFNICWVSSRPVPTCCRSSTPGPACCRRANSRAGRSSRRSRIVEGVRAQGAGRQDHRLSARRGRAAAEPMSRRPASTRVSIDWAAEPSLIRERVQSRVAVQGNLDPLVLIAGGAALDRAVDDVLANYAQGRLIFNLGHGIQPETPIAHVEQMLKRVRAYTG